MVFEFSEVLPYMTYFGYRCLPDTRLGTQGNTVRTHGDKFRSHSAHIAAYSSCHMYCFDRLKISKYTMLLWVPKTLNYTRGLRIIHVVTKQCTTDNEFLLCWYNLPCRVVVVCSLYFSGEITALEIGLDIQWHWHDAFCPPHEHLKTLFFSFEHLITLFYNMINCIQKYM